MSLMLKRRLALLAVLVIASQGCKPKNSETLENEDSSVAFVPVAAGAAVGVNVALEATAAAAAVYAADCARPVAQGEVRFFCDGGIRLGQAAVGLVVRSVQTLATSLQWSHANILAYLSTLSSLQSNNVLKSAISTSSNAGALAGAKISPEIKSESGRKNLAYGLKQAIRIEDREKRNCIYLAQYEARLIPRDYKGNWMGGTSMRFFAKAPTPESAEAMAKFLCEEYAEVHFKIAPTMGTGLPRSLNECRKPKIIGNYKEKYRTEEMRCPSARACSNETNCYDIPL